VKFLWADSENRFKSTNHPEASGGISVGAAPAMPKLIRGIERKIAQTTVKRLIYTGVYLFIGDRCLDIFFYRLFSTYGWL